MSGAEDPFGSYDGVGGDDESPVSRARPFPDPPEAESPVVPLGFIDGDIIIAMPEGVIRRVPAARLGQMIKTDIYACEAGAAFLSYFVDDDDKFSRDNAVRWLVRKCRKKGPFDWSRPQLGLGVWMAPGPLVVLHRGGDVDHYGPAGERGSRKVAETLKDLAGPLYRLRPDAPKPAAPAKVSDGQWVRAQLDHWRFEPIGDDGLTGADVVAGWLMAALLGGAAPFRGHVMLHALAASGKTTLLQFIQACQSALAGDVIDEFTEAGIRNAMAGMARPVLLDEQEASTNAFGAAATDAVMELLRRMATGDGGNRKSGDIGGGSVTQIFLGAAIVAAITPPRLAPAMATRTAELRLLPLTSPGPRGEEVPLLSREALAAMREKARTLAAALLGRALEGAWRYRDDVAMLAGAMRRSGLSPRLIDLVAGLAAGRRLLLHDEPLTEEAADEEIGFWRGLVAGRQIIEESGNNGQDALAFLMAAPSGKHVSDRIVSLGWLIETWVLNRSDAPGGTEDVLKAHGLRLQKGEGDREGWWLVVANIHPELDRLFARSIWKDWNRSLSDLDHLGPEFQTRPTENSVRFGLGIKSRGLAIPLAPWMRAERPFHSVPPTVPEQDDGF